MKFDRNKTAREREDEAGSGSDFFTQSESDQRSAVSLFSGRNSPFRADRGVPNAKRAIFTGASESRGAFLFS
jgi:hypothetical protein